MWFRAATRIAGKQGGGVRQVWTAETIFDGTRLVRNRALLVSEGRVVGLIPVMQLAPDAARVDLGEGILCPGFIDLQVNGGGGALLGQGDPDTGLETICAAHARMGSTGVLPTLITGSPQVTQAVLAAAARAARRGLPGFLGLHLEGPFLDPARCGAHDPALIRPMTSDDLDLLVRAAARLPVLKVTLAPESVTPDKIAALARAGVIVSLGHSDATEEAARVAMGAGASVVTHLFNAMSPLSHRAPGLVGAALDSAVWAGIIPDGVHVSATAFRLALRAKPGRMFAVSDAMAVAGTDLTEFTLNGRRIARAEGRLTLADGTLAGADISLPRAVGWMVRQAGVELATALAMVTSLPARVIGAKGRGVLAPGARADLVHLTPQFGVRGVWRAGQPVA